MTIQRVNQLVTNGGQRTKMKRGELRRARERDDKYMANVVILFMQVGMPPYLMNPMTIFKSNEWLKLVFYPAVAMIEWGELGPPPIELYIALIRKVRDDQQHSARGG